MQTWRRLPPALVGGLVLHGLAALGNAAVSAIRVFDIRWPLAARGFELAATLLLAVGWLALARTTTGRPRLALRAVAGLGLALAGWWLGVQLLSVVHPLSVDIYRVSLVVSAVGHTALVLLLVTAAEAWRGARWAAAAALGVVVVRCWLDFVPGLERGITRDPALGLAFILLTEAAWLAALTHLATRIARDPAPDPGALTAGLHAAARAIHLRVALGIAIAVFALTMLRIDPDPSLRKLIYLGAPIAIAGALAAVAWNLLRAANSRVTGLPVGRMVAGAALVTWWAAVQMYQQLYAHQKFGMIAGDDLAWWSLGGPLIATAGLAATGSALVSLAGHRAADTARRAIATRTIVCVLLSLVGIALSMQATAGHTTGKAVAAFVLATVATTVAQLVFARALAIAATDAAAEQPLPPARVV